MKKMFKAMAVLAILAMMFGTVACSHSDDDDDDYVSSTGSTSTSSTEGSTSSSTTTNSDTESSTTNTIESSDTEIVTEDTSTESTSDETESALDSSVEAEEEEYTLALENNCKQLTIYYYRESGYDDCDIWMWYCGDGEEEDTPLYGQVFHTCSYGAKVVVNVPDKLEKVGFIIRINCSDAGGTVWDETTEATKDATEYNRFVTLTGDYTIIYTKEGDENYYTSAEDASNSTNAKNENVQPADWVQSQS